MITLDLEWDGNDPEQKLLVLGMDSGSWPAAEVPRDMYKRLANHEPKVVFTKSDHHWLANHGVVVGGPIIDVQTMCWAYDERTPLSLDWCVKEYLGYDPDKRLVKKAGKVWFRCDDGEIVLIADAPIDQLVAYNQRDVMDTKRLYNEMVRRLDAVGMYEYWEKMHKPFSKVLLKMELNGMPIDVEQTEAAQMEFQAEADVIEKNIRELQALPPEFNLNSRDQIANMLFTTDWELKARIKLGKERIKEIREYDWENEEWPKDIPMDFSIDKIGNEYLHGAYQLAGRGLKPKVKAPKCAKGVCGHKNPREHEPSVSSKALKVHHGDDLIVQELVEYRMYTKALQFLNVWLEVEKDGRLYTHFNQTGTATGRLSSSDPINLQNVPSRGPLGDRIRGLFVPPPEALFVNGDFSQIEPRLMAHFSQDPAMMEVFEKGLDLYEEATVAVLGDRYPKGTPERQLIRTCFLAMGYGAQPPKIQNNLAEDGFRIPLAKVEKSYYDLIDLYKVFWEYKDMRVEQARRDKYVTTIAGHRRHLDFSRDSWKAERQAVNSEIQGSAGDITQGTMIDADEALPAWRMILQVHDEIMFQVTKYIFDPADLDTFQWIAEHQADKYNLTVPIVFEPKVVYSWGEK